MDILRNFGVPQSPTTRDRSGNLSKQTRGVKSAPPSPSKATEGWTCLQDYRYLSTITQKDVSESFDHVLEKFDENRCKKVQEEIGSLLVVAGLFLAIVTAFVIDSYKLLQEDKQDELSKLLVEVVLLLNDTSTQGHAKLPKRSTPDHHDVVVNQLWFLSMILSLIAVLIGTFCLQWTYAFLKAVDLTSKSASPEKSLQMRHLRRSGLIGWGVLYAPEALLLLVQLSIALFSSGLIYFLWNVNHAAAIPTLIAAAVAGLLLCLANLMPFLQSLIGVFFPKFLAHQCPYKSPTSWLLTGVCDLLALTLKGFRERWRSRRGVVGRFSDWLDSRPAPWADYLWKAHDSSYAKLQDSWKVCSRFDSYRSGLFSALDILVLEPDAAEIITSSLLNLRWGSGSETSFYQDVFTQTLNPIERRALGRSPGIFAFADPNAHDAVDEHNHVIKLVDDFFTALVLQEIAFRSVKLRRILLRHRFELYIRIKNSSVFVVNDPNTPKTLFSHSLQSPVVGYFDIRDLDPELQFQFLNCLRRCMKRGLVNNITDLLVTAEIIRCDSHFPDVPEVYSGHGKRREQGNDDNFPGTQHTCSAAEEDPHVPTCCSQQPSGGCKATDTREDTNPDVAPRVSDARGADRPDCGGGVNADGQKGKRNASHISSGAIHTNIFFFEDDKMPRSSQHDVYELKRAEELLFRAKFRSICRQVREMILEVPESKLGEVHYYRLRYKLGFPRVRPTVSDHQESIPSMEGAKA